MLELKVDLIMDVQLFLLLLAGHYLADFALQTEHMAKTKQLVFIKSMGFHSLTAHAFIHGLVAGVFSQRLLVGVVVGLTHWVIDFGKASQLLDDRFPHTNGSRKNGQKYGLYGINVDQTLHVGVILACVLIFAN